MRRRLIGPLVLGAVFASFIVVPRAGASGNHVTFGSGRLTIIGTKNSDDITVSCSANAVVVTPFSTPAVACDQVKRVVVHGEALDDSIDIGGLSIAGGFTALVSVKAFGEGNEDDFTLSDAPTFVDGGSDSDNIQPATPSSGSVVIDQDSLAASNADTTFTSIEGAFIPLANTVNSVDASAFGGHVNVAGGTQVDTVLGTNKFDSLQSNGGNDVFSGRGGSDEYVGGPGNDTFNGGAGLDELTYFGFDTDVTLTDTSFTGTGLGSDTLSSVEHGFFNQTGSTGRTVNLGAFNGTSLWNGGSGADTFTASQAGSDMHPGAGNDTLTGGPGFDHVFSTTSTNATLTDTSITGQGTDTISGIDSIFVSGSAAANVMNAAGFSGKTHFDGDGGGDVLVGGPGPSDFDAIADGSQVTGGGGKDTVFTVASPNGLLGATDTNVAGDHNFTISSIEDLDVGMLPNSTVDTSAFSGTTTIRGSDGGQSFVGGPGADHVSLGTQNDTARGGGGKDTLLGGDGNDHLNGGASIDTCKGGVGVDHLISCEKGKP